MGPLSRWAVLNPKKAVLIWVLAFLAIGGFANAVKGEFNDSFSLPDTESSQAQQVLDEQFGGFGGGADTEEATVVFGVTGDITSADNVKRIEAVLAELEENPSVVSTQSPFAQPEGAEGDLAAQQEQAQAEGDTSSDPAGTAGAFLSPISEDKTVARAAVVFKAEDDVVVQADVKKFLAVVEESNADDFRVGAAGQIVEFSQEDPPPSEALGILVALVVMALMFGAVVAAGLPIVTAVFGLILGQILVLIVTRFLDVPAFAPILASLIGLGVGIDYSLFVINRFKAATDVGREPRAAAIEAVNTSGRAVLFAGTTVIIALAGLFILRINFINGLAVASMLTVFTVMLAALWLLPALLSWMGLKTFALKLPWTKNRHPHPRGTAFARYGEWLQRRPWPLAIGGLIVMVLFALPVGSLQQGFADQSGSKPDTPGRVGYDLLTEGFGAGINGPFIIVAELPEPGDLESAGRLAAAVQEAEGVAGASNPIPDNTEDPTQATAAIITVYPTTGPQAEETGELLERLRTEIVPAAEAETGIQASVGGAKAIVADFGKVLSDALPLFLFVVIGLGILALTVLFRSILVPVMGALASLLSFGAALGIAVAVFQWGWAKDLFGIEATGPIAPFFPPFLFAILFGLSMDYQVFLVSRMQEEWSHTKDNHRSIRRGLASSGRVVAAAAIIMASVFLGFVLGDEESKLFGLTLALAILLDAFVIRLVIIPSLMTVLGGANWWLPGWLDRVLPHLSVETSDEEFEAEAALIEDVPNPDDDVRSARV